MEVVVSDDRTAIRPVQEDARVLVNGMPVQKETVLRHNDRLVFGSTQMWVFQNPKEGGAGPADINGDFMLQEIAAKSGLSLSATMRSQGKHM